MVRCLTIFAIATIFSGCSTVPLHVPITCPERFEFAEYSDELWDSIPEEAQLNINQDDVAAKDYILQCEANAEIHNAV
jgi:hypothetical protein